MQESADTTPALTKGASIPIMEPMPTCGPHKRLNHKLAIALALPGAILLVLLSLSCAGRVAVPPTATPDYAALETQVLAKLYGTLTAKAPPPTHTPTPTDTPIPPTATHTPTPSATPSPSPSPAPRSPVLAYVHVMADDSANIVLHDPQLEEDEILTRFAEPQSMSDITWSRDGDWVVFVSAHDYIHSRDNERNVFLIQRDGTKLRMVTGDYVDPSVAPGPYAILKGQVVGGKCPCLVCAQGVASPVTTDKAGAFELPGVPISTTWVRAVCQQEDCASQGDVALHYEGDGFVPVTITVEARGQGWTQASLSRDGDILAGTSYRWTLDEEGKRQYQMQGVLCDLQGRYLGTLDVLTDTTLIGLDWSPVEDKLVGALTGSKKTWLWLWDSVGTSLGSLVEITNTEQEILSAANPVWSPDGMYVAFELHRWYWWGENKYKTDLMLVSATGKDLHPVVETEWGIEASHPTWTADGRGLFYQLAENSTGSTNLNPTGGDIWSVTISPQATPVPWTEDGLSYLPAWSPPERPVPKPDVLRSGK